MTFDDTLIGREVMELKDAARWRSEKAEQYPEDDRNAEAEKLLLKLAAQLREMSEFPKATLFEAFHDFIFSGSEQDNPDEVVRLWGEYRSRTGFSRFPESAEEYIDDLMELARDAS